MVMRILPIGLVGLISLTIMIAGGETAIASTTTIAQASINEAQKAYDMGEKLFQQGDAASLRQAIGYFERSLQLGQQNRHELAQAVSLMGLGRVYQALGENQTALAYYQQALALWRDLKVRDSEATALNNIGFIYSELGEKQKALDYLNQSLRIRQKIGDRLGEATVPLLR